VIQVFTLTLTLSLRERRRKPPTPSGSQSTDPPFSLSLRERAGVRVILTQKSVLPVLSPLLQ